VAAVIQDRGGGGADSAKLMRFGKAVPTGPAAVHLACVAAGE